MDEETECSYFDFNSGEVKTFSLKFTEEQIHKAGEYLKSEIDKYAQKESNNE
jgi:hypothetical protein